MPVRKASSIDGLPFEFNKAFWSDLCDDIMEVVEKGFAEVFFASELHESCSNILTKER